LKDPYRRIARFYDVFVEPPNAALRSIALSMAPPTAGMRVLDVGCGTGGNMERYQRKGCRVFGIDPSPSMIDVARSKLGGHAELELGSAADMPYEDSSFDVVTAFLTLHEIPHHARDDVVAEMTRVVSPDGRLVLVDYRKGNISFPRGWMFKLVILALELGAGRRHFASYRDFMARDGLPGLLAKHSLRVVDEKVVSAGNMHALVVRA
jgi:ubiquinone/menaquinone biosynthesis C-methylase UbiE